MSGQVCGGLQHPWTPPGDEDTPRSVSWHVCGRFDAFEANDLAAVFQVYFSEPGTHARDVENQTICFWRDWLIDVEGTKPLKYNMVNIIYHFKFLNGTV